MSRRKVTARTASLAKEVTRSLGEREAGRSSSQGVAAAERPRTDAGDALERLVALGLPKLTGSEVASLADVDRDVADRLWRALGFPDTDEDERAFSDQDVRALKIATEGLADLSTDEKTTAVEMIVREARILSAYMAGLAEVESDAIPALHALGLRRTVLEDATQRGLQHSDLEWLIMFGFRRQLQAAMRRRHAEGIDPRDPGHPALAVGFIDLADYTGLSNRAEPEQLDALLASFETLVFDTVTELGGRVVKLIGDEAMFVCPSASGGVQAALAVIADRSVADLPLARAGIAYGPLLRRNGDYFGRPVNLASRLVGAAAPGEVLVDAGTRNAVGSTCDLDAHALPPLKGLGLVQAWRAAAQPSADDAGVTEQARA